MSLVLVFEYLDSNDCGMYVLWLFDRYPNELICFWIKFWFALQMVTSLCIDRSIDRFCRLLLGNDQRPQWPQSESRLKRLIGPQVKDPYNSGDEFTVLLLYQVTPNIANRAVFPQLGVIRKDEFTTKISFHHFIFVKLFLSFKIQIFANADLKEWDK